MLIVQTNCIQISQYQKKKPFGLLSPTSMYSARALQRTVERSSSINL
jgi:hypothetical protein